MHTQPAIFVRLGPRLSPTSWKRQFQTSHPRKSEKYFKHSHQFQVAAVLMRRLAKEDVPRTIQVQGLTDFAIEDDLKTLFEENGFKLQQTLMTYNPLRGYSNRMCYVVLETPSQVVEAIKKLNRVPVFDRRVNLSHLEAGLHTKATILPGLPIWFTQRLGWYATANPSLGLGTWREPLFTYPKKLFAPVLESRRVIIENLPDLTVVGGKIGDPEILNSLYALFHRLDVHCCSSMMRYTPGSSQLSGYAMSIDFATSEEAQTAIRIGDGQMILGHRITVAVSKIPLKYTVSWDTTRGGGHNRTGRDMGSAVGTNFEEVEDFRFSNNHMSNV